MRRSRVRSSDLGPGKLCSFFCSSKEDKLLKVIKHKDSTLQGKWIKLMLTCTIVHWFFKVKTLQQLIHPRVSPQRHRDCHYLLPPSYGCVRCLKCTRHRSSLLIQSKRLENSTPSKKTNYRFLSKQGLVDRVQQAHSQVKVMTKRNLRLKKKLETQFEENGMSVSEETHNDLATVIERNSDIVDSLPPNSFQRLFWGAAINSHVQAKFEGQGCTLPSSHDQMVLVSSVSFKWSV